MKQLLTFILIPVFCVAQAQIFEHFSDGNFTNTPAWFGDDSLFQVNSIFLLQSKGTLGTSKDISLATASNFMDSAEWQCWVKFNLSPSSQNFCRFYLASDQLDLKGSLNGYYVQFGGVTGNTDSITLYKQKGVVKTRIIAGRASTVSKATNMVRIKVLRDKLGNWQLFSDTLGGSNFALEGTGTDAEFITSIFCGFFVKYTSTNVSNYFLDDVYAGSFIVDITPPIVDSVNIINANTLRIKFSEDVDAATAINTTNYFIDNNVGIAVNANFEAGSNAVLVVQFQNNFINGNNYLLTVTNINDLNFNTLSSENVPFLFFIPQKEDVLISEFFPDPTPIIGLPDQEFIELYNRTNFTVNLSGWTLTDGTTISQIPTIDLKPDSFLIVCSSANLPLFVGFGKSIGVNSFPSLNNSGDLILLKDKNGNIIHQLNYNLNWYADNTKKDGGWSIEMKNPFDVCKDKNNFSASTNSTGGTPGKVNSQWTKILDTIPPQLVSVFPSTQNQLLILFSEKMDSLSLTIANTAINVGVSVLSKTISTTNIDSLTLTTSSFISNNKYTFSISGAKDCNQNPLRNLPQSFEYFLPDTAKAYDIVINELMVNPTHAIALPNDEYIELHNVSTKNILLKNWTIEDAVSKAILPNYILKPDSFVIITSSSSQTDFKTVSAVFGVLYFPSLNNDGETIILKNESGKIIHAINYTSDWYNDNVKKNGGWSLEIIDPKNPCAGKENWSASKNNGGGTPGKTNSINALNRDKTPPKLLRAFPINNNEVNLFFNEPLDSFAIINSSTIHINFIGSSSSAHLQPAFYNSFIANFTDSFQAKNVYRILVDSIKDCAGNLIMDDNYADFGLPENYDSMDIVINELLFNPRSGGFDFVELYNRTDKVIDLKKLFIANANDDNSINDIYPITPDGFLLFPKSYCAISENIDVLKQQYSSPNIQNFIQSNLPSFNDDKGVAILIDATGKRYDQFNYDDKMHFPLLDNKDGVSLERIDFNRPTTDRSNWTSAATQVNATPAYRNSQFVETRTNGNHLFVEPEVFSPDDDGYKDIVNFSYTFDESGYTGNLFIYDSKGVLVKQVLHNELLGSNGTYSWNGITDKNTKVPIGIYVVYFEVFNLTGDVKQYRSTVVVGGKI